MSGNMQMPLKMSVVVGVSLLGFAPGAYAYLDPSTGSMILSAIIGILATLSLAVKTYWYKLKSLFNKSESLHEPEAESETEEAP